MSESWLTEVKQSRRSPPENENQVGVVATRLGYDEAPLSRMVA
jgi:hypothetical protein